MFWSENQAENDEKAETSSNTSQNEQEEAVEDTEKDKRDQENSEEKCDEQNGPESLENDEKPDKEEDVSEKKSSKESSSSRYLNHRALFRESSRTPRPNDCCLRDLSPKARRPGLSKRFLPKSWLSQGFVGGLWGSQNLGTHVPGFRIYLEKLKKNATFLFIFIP